MATYSYTNTITQVDNATINFELLSVVPPTTVVTSISYSRFTNMITTVIANMAASFPSNPLPNDYDLTSTAAGMGSVFGDSVYRYESNFVSGSDEYESDDYFLVCTAIDAGILAYPTATDADAARKTYLVALRALVDTEFAAENYTTCNNLITGLTYYLFDITDATLTFVATLPSPEQITLTGSNGMPTTYTGGWYNVLTNTLTEVEYPYTWNFTTPGQTKDVIQTSAYPDGVYTNYSSVMVYYNPGGLGSKTAKLYAGTSYLLVTTGITAGITAWQAAYDQLVNPTQTQIDDNTFLDGALAAIQAAFDAELYTEANTLIAEVQAILSGGIGIAMYLNLATTGTKAYKEANMLNYFSSGTLPSGTYSNQVSTLTNTITNEEWNFPSAYPANATDYTEILNSNDLATLSKWNDAVYRSNVEFNVGVTAYQCLGYCLVLTSMNCVITKLTQSADSCKSLQKQLGKLVSLRQMAIDSFNAGNFTGANSAIKKFNNVTDSCNCGCR